MMRKLAEMYIQDEFGLAERVIPNLCDGRNIEFLKHRIESNPVVFVDGGCKTNRDSIDKCDINKLGWNTNVVEHIQENTVRGERKREGDIAPILREEVVQFGIAPDKYR